MASPKHASRANLAKPHAGVAARGKSRRDSGSSIPCGIDPRVDGIDPSKDRRGRQLACSDPMAAVEWIHLTRQQLDADPSLAEAIDRFQAPKTPAGDAAAEWLKGHAIREMGRIATYVLVRDGEVIAFHSLGMSEVLLRTQQRKQLSATHPRQGAVLILWLARASDAQVDAETILRHAVGIGQIGARRVGAAVIALDPYDDATERFWRKRFGFRNSLTSVPDAAGGERRRLWMPLFPED